MNFSRELKTKLLFFSLLCFQSIHAEEIHPVIVPQSSLLQTALPVADEDEVVVVERLIAASQEQLSTQERLKELMINFKKQKELFIQGEQTKKQASLMVRTAREILDIISKQHIQYLFAPDYIQELTLFSSIAGKNTIKRP